MLPRSLHVAVIAVFLLLGAPGLAMPMGSVVTGSGQSGVALDDVAVGSRGGRTSTSGSLFLIRMALDIGTDTFRALGSVDMTGHPQSPIEADVMLGSLRLTSVTGARFFGDHSASTAGRQPHSLLKAAMGSPMDLSPSRVKPSSNPIPEPASVALYLMGLAAVGFGVRRLASGRAAA